MERSHDLDEIQFEIRPNFSSIFLPVHGSLRRQYKSLYMYIYNFPLNHVLLAWGVVDCIRRRLLLMEAKAPEDVRLRGCRNSVD